MSSVHRKNFSDRYALLREHQILDYLNQRDAQVPRVILSHVEQGYLDMTDGGQDVDAWLRSGTPTLEAIARVLADALDALMSIARLGVWHLDIAPRNFVVKTNAGEGFLTVQVIDFSNAVAQQFPLQKPLWMLPSHDQHPLLAGALAADWEAFFARHGLNKPVDWMCAFDVPSHAYRNDWVTALQVEALDLRWCVMAHGVARMLMAASPLRQENLPSVNLHDLLSLRDETHARHALQGLSAALHELADHRSRKTPRPRAAGASSAPDPAAATGQPDAFVFHPRKSIEKNILPRLWCFLGLVMAVLGWWHMDQTYEKYSVLLGWWGWMCLGSVLVGSLWLALLWLVRSFARRWVAALVMLHVMGQALMWLELWARRVPLI